MAAEGVSREPGECRLDLPALQTQLGRYGQLSRHVEKVRRWPGLLEVCFSPEVDETLLNEAIAVERECCPFFELDYDGTIRRLAVTVEDPRHDAAIDALRFALTPS